MVRTVFLVAGGMTVAEVEIDGGEIDVMRAGNRGGDVGAEVDVVHDEVGVCEGGGVGDVFVVARSGSVPEVDGGAGSARVV